MANLLQLQPGEHIQTIIDTRDYETNRFLFFATRQGQVKKTKFNDYDSSLRTGIIAINLRDGDELVKVIPTNGGDDILMLPHSAGHPLLRGRRPPDGPSRRRRAGHEDAGRRRGREPRHLPRRRRHAHRHRRRLRQAHPARHFNRQGRGGQGVRGIKLTAKKGHVVAAFMVGLDDEIFVINSVGTLIRMPVRDISSQGRDATGVRVMNLATARRSPRWLRSFRPTTTRPSVSHYFPRLVSPGAPAPRSGEVDMRGIARGAAATAARRCR